LTTVYFAAIDGDMAQWSPLKTTVAALRNSSDAVTTPDDVAERAAFGFRFDLIVRPPAQLLELDDWRHVVGAVIDLESRDAPMDPDVLHARVCAHLAGAHTPATPIMARRTGYHLLFLIGGPRPTARQELLIDALEAQARSRLGATGAPVDAPRWVGSLDAYRSMLNTVEWRMRVYFREVR
jgi:hypothetical protein